MSGIPVYVISFNQPTYLRNMITQLRGLRVAPEEIHVVDNASTSSPLLDNLAELESQGYQVHRIARNLGPYVVFHPDATLHLPSVFAVTDPDLQFDARMPSTFRADLVEIARRCDTWKAGCALTLRGNWRQGGEIEFQGETYFWSKDHELRKFIDLPRRVAEPIEFATGLEAAAGGGPGAARGEWLAPRRRARVHHGSVGLP
jgi:hypothetical protein